MKQIIEFAYLNPPRIKKNINSLKKIDFNTNTIIYQVPSSGVSSEIFLHLYSLKSGSYLYINFDDLFFYDCNLENFDKFLQDFISSFYKSNKTIDCIVIENYKKVANITFIENIIFILTSKMEYKQSLETHLVGFKNLCFYPLSYKEFIKIKKQTISKKTFSDFIKESTFIELAIKEKNLFHSSLQALLTSLIRDKQELEVILFYFKYQSLSISTYHLFTLIKKKVKISKDTFYDKVKLLRDKQMLLLVAKFNHLKENKKIFFIDFSLPKIIKPHNDIKALLENYLLLELLKKNKIIKDIYYTDDFDFYLPKDRLAFSIILFQELSKIDEHIWYLDAMIKEEREHLDTIYILTLNDEYSFYNKNINNISYQVITFWELANNKNL